MADAKTLFTIGYARFSIEGFLETLKAAGINAVVDVRAAPNVTRFDAYKRDNVKASLEGAGIIYKFFGRQLGARPVNAELYTDGKVDFDKIRKWPDFIRCVANLKTGLDKGMNICLMCAQVDPIICHRSILITDAMRLAYPDTPILHITPKGVETQTELDRRVLQLYKKAEYKSSLLAREAAADINELAKAYAWQGANIAFETGSD